MWWCTNELSDIFTKINNPPTLQNLQAQERHGTAEDRIRGLEAGLEEKNTEVLRLNQRLKMNEEHNARLSSTVDKLLSESNDRLQVHLKERMHALDEKNMLQQELEKARKLAEELHHDKGDIVKELSKTRLETENFKRQLLQQEIAFNIQQTEALTRSLSPSHVTTVEQNNFTRSTSQHTNFDSLRRNKRLEEEQAYARSLAEQVIRGQTVLICFSYFKSSCGKSLWIFLTFSSFFLFICKKEWAKMPPAHVLANVQQGFDVPTEADDTESLFSTAEIMSPTGHTDAQTLAMMLQEQLDAINNEIRLIQEEKQSTEARAEELESRVGSLEHMNLLVRGRSSMDRQSPPLSGRSTPNSPNRDYLHKYHTVRLNILTLTLTHYLRSSIPMMETENRETGQPFVISLEMCSWCVYFFILIRLRFCLEVFLFLEVLHTGLIGVF